MMQIPHTALFSFAFSLITLDFSECYESSVFEIETIAFIIPLIPDNVLGGDFKMKVQ